MAQKTLKGKYRLLVAKTANFGEVVNQIHDVVQDAADTSTTHYDDQFYNAYTAPNATALLAQCLADYGQGRRDELAHILADQAANSAPK